MVLSLGGIFSAVSNFVGGFLSSKAAPALLTGAATLFSAKAERDAARDAQAVAGQEAAFQQQRTDLELTRASEDARQRLATQRAILSKAGRDLSGSTELNLLSEQERQDALDADIIRLGGDINKARFVREGEKQKTLSRTRPIQTLLSGGAKTASLIR